MDSQPIDYSENKEYAMAKSEIAKLKEELAKTNDLKLQELSNRQSYLEIMLKQIIGDLAVAERNKELDKQIDSLRAEKKRVEVNRANAEKILFQVEEFKKAKNKQLTADINKHFEVVNWHLWKTLKNGNYEECCEPYIGDKSMTSHSNQALQVVCKLDIIKGLQKFYDIHLPVFVDDASLLTENSTKTINMDTQTIWLMAVDGIKEVVVKGE